LSSGTSPDPTSLSAARSSRPEGWARLDSATFTGAAEAEAQASATASARILRLQAPMVAGTAIEAHATATTHEPMGRWRGSQEATRRALPHRSAYDRAALLLGGHPLA
jgi:hypothetical protein